MKVKESETSMQNCLRKEIWVRPDGGRRVHRTTSTMQEQRPLDSEDEDLQNLSSADVSTYIYFDT